MEPLKKGEQFIEWPLHITIVPWFAMPEEEYVMLDSLLSKIAAKHKTFNVKVGGIEMFAKGTLAVKLIEPSQELQALHRDVFNTLENNGFPIHQKEFLGDKYRPHFIYKPEDKIKTGTAITVHSFSLIKQIRQKVTGIMVKELASEYILA